jgi:hypothetical protein
MQCAPSTLTCRTAATRTPTQPARCRVGADGDALQNSIARRALTARRAGKAGRAGLNEAHPAVTDNLNRGRRSIGALHPSLIDVPVRGPVREAEGPALVTVH